MLKAIVTFYDERPSLTVVIGVGEDMRAPRDLAALEKQGWVINDDVELAYKTYLAGRRQGDIGTDVKFEDWVGAVGEIDAQPSRKQVEQAVLLGGMTREQADALLSTYGDDDEEKAVTPRTS